MKGSFFKKLVIIFLVFVGLGALLKMSGDFFGSEDKRVTAKNTILHLEMNGVILNGKKFIKNLKKYREDDKVKAILISINSPGGSVGPSQEMFAEIKRVRDEIKKPVVCVSTGVMASGAYYAAVACDKIVVAPGALVGSIGVIMEFANLEKLYDWAKISRYSITSGKFKDSGAEYRPMREDERSLFQSMIDEVYAQFKGTVAAERKLKEEVVAEYADGRVFTGATAVKVGFADQEGYYDDAVKLAAEIAKLGDNYEVFEVPKKKVSIFDLGGGDSEDDLNSMSEFADVLKGKSFGPDMEGAMKYILRAKYLNQPLMLMPGYWE
ncbi:signal peptide peptidase SppA [Bdellovibrio bacteriovorus]|uniref:Signal peptide peptidase n=1 Tax=Bdellovibrio bacteriovorus str. Tiberius TaxID=1069642 RepID=K7YSU4_BDEBC|nr:signal peptide peptidase SppA [Bdellovibrio bacteriovorus]AFY00708.1 signal peptide peptidase [Bdellovibrio bacteriovorus str. Tiberius]